MSEPTKDEAPGDGKSRRWFVILAIITLIGFALFTGAITVLAVRIPELKKPKFGLIEGAFGERRA
jgi:hypothetical protein